MWFKVYDHFIELKISQKPKGRLSLWDTNAGSNFCDPHLELIWRNKWHLETLEVSTSLEITVGTHFHMWHGTKTTPVFLPVDGEASCLLLPKLISVLSSSTVQPENIFLYSEGSRLGLISVDLLEKTGCEAGWCNETSTL